MGRIFVISDTHFQHENIIKYCNRPFKNAAHQTETLISNWNKVVGKEDTVIVTGDFIMGSSENISSILNQLEGRIVLVRGNHDEKSKLDIYAKYPEKIEIYDMYTMSYMGLFFVFCHFPFTSPEFLEMVRTDNSEIVVIHGHIHDRGEFFDKENHVFNVSVEQINYTPIALDVIYDLVKKDFKEKGVWRGRKQKDNSYCVYLYRNLSNGKVYVGQTNQSLEKRAKYNGTGYSDCPRFWKAIQKYGWDNFSSIVLKKKLSSSLADEYERFYIELYMSTDPEIGYNVATEKPVIQYSLNGEEVARFNSMSEAARVNNISASNISRICKRDSKRLTAGSFLWRLAEDPLQMGEIEEIQEKIIQSRIEARRGQSIGVFDSETKLSYPSISLASKETGIPRTTLGRWLNNGIRFFRLED